jgi:hypothetical protein
MLGVVHAQAQTRRLAAAHPQDHRFSPAEVDHRGGLQGAGASGDHAGNLVLEALANLLGVIQRLGFARRDQGGGPQRGE